MSTDVFQDLNFAIKQLEKAKKHIAKRKFEKAENDITRAIAAASEAIRDINHLEQKYE